MAVIKKEVFNIRKDDFAAAGEASSKIKSILKELGVGATIVRMVAIASYEAELNMIIHSLGGEMILEVEPNGIRLICRDTGPGIQNIEDAMREGFSTAPENIRMMGFGAGMGLPNIKRHCHDFSIKSQIGQGTEIIVGYTFSE